MPNLDGTGPMGRRSHGRRATVLKPRGLGGTSVCTCPSCGHERLHKRGVPCSTVLCPKCKTPLAGENC